MKSKIRVEFDFDKSEPYIQLSIDTSCLPNEQADMRDTVLKNFVERSSSNGVEVVFPTGFDNNDYPQLRIVKKQAAPYVPPIDWREFLLANHAKINAQYQQSWGQHEFYKNGDSYNLMFGIDDNNCILIMYGGGIFTEKDTFIRYTNLSQFLEYWTVNKPSKS